MSEQWTRSEVEHAEAMLVELLTEIADCTDDEQVPLGWLVESVADVELGELRGHHESAGYVRAQVREALERLALIRPVPS